MFSSFQGRTWFIDQKLTLFLQVLRKQSEQIPCLGTAALPETTMCPNISMTTMDLCWSARDIIRIPINDQIVSLMVSMLMTSKTRSSISKITRRRRRSNSSRRRNSTRAIARWRMIRLAHILRLYICLVCVCIFFSSSASYFFLRRLHLLTRTYTKKQDDNERETASEREKKKPWILLLLAFLTSFFEEETSFHSLFSSSSGSTIRRWNSMNLLRRCPRPSKQNRSL